MGKTRALPFAAAMLVAAGAVGSTAAAAPPATGGSSLFVAERGAAIEAARYRLRASIVENRAAPAACDVASADTMRAVVGAGGAIELELDPWSQAAEVDPRLLGTDDDSSSVAANVSQTVLRCSTDRPAADQTTRPAVIAVVVDDGLTTSSVAARPLAARLDIEPIVPLSSSALGGETVGSCQGTVTIAVCSALWVDDGLALGFSFEGPPAALTPASTKAILEAGVPEIVDSLAVRRLTPSACTPEAINDDTAAVVSDRLACADGWAVGVATECPSTGCTALEVFHLTDAGWVGAGTTTNICAESVATFGASGVTAAELVTPFTPPPPPPAPSAPATTTTTTTVVPPPPPCNDDADVLDARRLDADDEGLRVTGLQAALVGLGYDLPVDGRFGPLTTAAVLDFQIANSIQVDAVVGSQTRQALGI